ncbi:MAG: molybdenum cofactor guanylyltransferase [Nitrospinae bacterium]|nr:molybdenum cofactor guanylyltransferase [Nitrospinota bacterium]
MMDKIDMTGIILAGGKGSRCNYSDKGTLELEGRPIIQSIAECLLNLFNDVLVVTNKPHLYGVPGVQIVEDDVEYLGSLNGVLCGLRASRTQFNFVVACDMPFVREDAIRYIAGKERDYDVLVPENAEGPQPLFAVYSKSCAPVMEDRVKRGLLKIQDVFPLVKTKIIPREEMAGFTSGLDPFFNINRLEDLAIAQGMKE